MQARIIVKLIDGSTIFGDWAKDSTKKECEEKIESTILPFFGQMAYMTIPSNGTSHYIPVHAILEFFVEERLAKEADDLLF